MIYDTFENLNLYFEPDQPLHQAISYARDFDRSQPDGRYDIKGDDIYALVMSYETGPASEKKFEAHQDYIDVQLLLTGREFLDVSLQQDLEIHQPYSPQGDVILFDSPAQCCRLLLQPGTFALLYPHDIHRPGCELDSKKQVRKMVVKIRL